MNSCSNLFVLQCKAHILGKSLRRNLCSMCYCAYACIEVHALAYRYICVYIYIHTHTYINAYSEIILKAAALDIACTHKCHFIHICTCIYLMHNTSHTGDLFWCTDAEPILLRHRLEATASSGGYGTVWRLRHRLEATAPSGGYGIIWRLRHRLEATAPSGGYGTVAALQRALQSLCPTFNICGNRSMYVCVCMFDLYV
jgi:hypothetical protein